MEIKNNIPLLEKQLKFWEELCKFCEKNEVNFKLSTPGKRQFFDLRMNSKYHIRLSMNSMKNEFQTGFYIEDDKSLYFYLLKNKEEIESLLDFSLIWQNIESKKSSVIYTKINFDIDNNSEWDNYLYIILNKSEKIIKVFKDFVDKYYEEDLSETKIEKENILKTETLSEEYLCEKEGLIKKILKKMFPFFYKKEEKKNIEKKRDNIPKTILLSENRINLEEKENKSESELPEDSLNEFEETEKIEIIKEKELAEENISIFNSALEEEKVEVLEEKIVPEITENVIEALENSLTEAESIKKLEASEDIEKEMYLNEEEIEIYKDAESGEKVVEASENILELEKTVDLELESTTEKIDENLCVVSSEHLKESEESEKIVLTSKEETSELLLSEEKVFKESNSVSEAIIKEDLDDDNGVGEKVNVADEDVKKEIFEPKNIIKREPKVLVKRKISEDLLVQKILPEEEMRDFGERLGINLNCGNLKPIFSQKIVIFLVSVAYYEGISDGGYWNKVFNILKLKYTQAIYTFLIETLRETLYHKHLFIDDSTQWAYNTIMAHTIVPLEGGAFYKYLDFAYSFYDSIDSDLTSVSDEELKLMVKELLEKEKDSPFMLKGTRLAIENCLNIVVEYFIEILYYIDILDSQKEDISDLGEVIKEKIKEWYDFNLSRGFSIRKSGSISSSEEDKEEIISITNRIGNLKFTCDKDGVNVEIPEMSFDYPIDDVFIKVGEQKNILNYRKVGNKFVVRPKSFTRKTFDFKLIKLFINGELVREWGNKVVFFKENGKNIKPKEKNGNIYGLDIKKVRILFESSYSIFSSTTKDKEISEVNITKSIKYADLNLEDEIYYLKKNNEIIIIKNLLKEEEPEVIIENNMVIKNILIEGKPVFNKHPEIFIPYTLPEKYKVFVNDEPLEVKEGFNKIDLKESGYYDIKICKGIKNTRETRVVRKEKQYFYFEDLNIVFYNEDGDKEYLFSHKEKKPVGNYNFDTTGISKVLYAGEEMEKCGNTFDIYIDNGFNKNFEFQMITDEDKEYSATGKMRILEWSLDGKNYFSEYNKNLLYEDIKDKVLTVRIDNLVGDVVFYGNSWEEMGKNKIEFKYSQEELERRGEDIGIKAVFRLSSDMFSKACVESLFKVRFNSKVKNVSYDKETGILDVKVRGKINDMILRIKDLNDEIIYEKEKLDLDNKLTVDLKGLYKVEISLEEEAFDFFAEEDNKLMLYNDFLEF